MVSPVEVDEIRLFLIFFTLYVTLDKLEIRIYNFFSTSKPIEVSLTVKNDFSR